jgi:hypothetical protein
MIILVNDVFSYKKAKESFPNYEIILHKEELQKLNKIRDNYIKQKINCFIYTCRKTPDPIYKKLVKFKEERKKFGDN